MNVIEWLLEAAPADYGPVPSLPSTIGARNPTIGDGDDAPEDDADDAGIDLEPVFMAIDYVDANGRETCRRITVRKISSGPNAPILTAVCHERKAVRHFRTDRIIDVIDMNSGEVVKPQTFFSEVFDVNLYNFKRSKALRVNNARTARDYLRPGLSILVSAAQCDGEFNDAELDAIMAWAERELPLMRDLGKHDITLDIDGADQLGRLIAKMRPTRSSIENYLRAVHGWREERRERFIAALAAVIRADGRFALEEQYFVDAVDELFERFDAEFEAERAKW